MIALLLALFWFSTYAWRCPGDPASTSIRTLRVDYFHTGGPRSGETFALDRVVNDGPWPGNRQQLDRSRPTSAHTGSKSRDAASGELIYSRGFASVYGEWETTAEARTAAPVVSRVGADPVAGSARCGS